MKNTLNTLQRDTYMMWFTQMMGYVHKEISSPFITVHKDERIQPAAKLLHFLFMLSQSLPQRLFTIQNNTIHSIVTMLSFIAEIPWENTTVNPIPWVHKTVGQQTSQKKFYFSFESRSLPRMDLM